MADSVRHSFVGYINEVLRKQLYEIGPNQLTCRYPDVLELLADHKVDRLEFAKMAQKVHADLLDYFKELRKKEPQVATPDLDVQTSWSDVPAPSPRGHISGNLFLWQMSHEPADYIRGAGEGFWDGWEVAFFSMWGSTSMGFRSAGNVSRPQSHDEDAHRGRGPEHGLLPHRGAVPGRLGRRAHPGRLGGRVRGTTLMRQLHP